MRSTTPGSADLVIRGARLPALFAGPEVDLVARDGEIAALGPGAGEGVEATATIDGAGGMLSVPFVEPHLHPDKFQSFRETDRFGGVGPERASALRTTYTAKIVRERSLAAFRLAAANGVGRLRATVDVDPGLGTMALEGALAAREAVAQVLDVEIVAYPAEGSPRDPATVALLEESFRLGADVLGGYPNGAANHQDGLADLDATFDLAERFGVPLDIHVDEWPDPGQVMLEALAIRTAERGLGGRVLADHCVALEAYPPSDAERVVAAVADARLAVCVMPNNLVGDPPYRGLSRLRELRAAGVIVCAGTDNVNDGWFHFGNLDPVERAFLTFVGSGMDRDDEIEPVWAMVTTEAERALGGAPQELRPGAPADVVLLPAPDVVQAMRRVPGRRVVIRGGRVVAGIDGGWRVEEDMR